MPSYVLVHYHAKYKQQFVHLDSDLNQYVFAVFRTLCWIRIEYMWIGSANKKC